jgi:hypothetical protein
MFPWKTLLWWILPSISDVITAVRTLKQEQGRQPNSRQGENTPQLYELEKSLDEQLHIIEQLTIQIDKLDKAYRLAAFLAVFALIIALISLGLAVFR